MVPKFHPGVLAAADSATLALLNTGAKLHLFGDSNLTANDYSLITPTTEFATQSRAEFTWVAALDSRFRLENWREVGRIFGHYVTNVGSLATNPFSTTNGSATVTVTHSGHAMGSGASYTGGAEYVFANATTVGGLDLNGGYSVLTVPSSSTFTIAASSTASSTTSGGGASVTYKQRGASAGPQNLGMGSNWGVSGDHAEGTLDLIQPGNGFPSSGSFTQTNISNDIAIVATGANDVNSSVANNLIQIKLTDIVNRLLALNFGRVVVLTMRPRSIPFIETLPDNPFTTTSGSAIVSVSHPNQPYNDGYTVTFTGATAVGGLTLNGSYVLSATNFYPDSYQFTAGGTASASETGGGTGITAVNSAISPVIAVNSTIYTNRKNLNDWLLTNPFGSNRVSIVDCDATMVDPAVSVNTTTGILGAAKRHYLIDGAHTTSLGAYHNARYGILPVLQSLVTSGTWFEDDPLVTGNILNNPGFSGTGGVKGAGITGTLPDNWQATRSLGVVTGDFSTGVVSGSINKITGTITSAANAAQTDSVLLAQTFDIGWNNSGVNKVVTVTILSSGLNPTIQIAHSSLSNGAPIIGGTAVLSNLVGGTLNGVDISGTWTVVSMGTPSSVVTYTFVATGQTASATGSSTRTVDWAYSCQSVTPLDTWVRYGIYVELSAWDKWRGLCLFLQSRNGSTSAMVTRAMRVANANLRWMPSEAWSGWLLSETVRLDTEMMGTATNLRLRAQLDVANEGTGNTTGTISFSRPFFRIVTDPTTIWV